MKQDDVIIDNIECTFVGNECCLYLTLSYDNSGVWDDAPYHLHVDLFGDFSKDDYFETKKDVIDELEDLDFRFASNILEGHDALKKIEAFEEPLREEVEE